MFRQDATEVKKTQLIKCLIKIYDAAFRRSIPKQIHNLFIVNDNNEEFIGP